MAKQSHSTPTRASRARSPEMVNGACARSTSPAVVHAVAILYCLDGQLRRVAPDAVSLARMDAVARGLTLPQLEELICRLNRALTLIGGALK
jgi:hypothetical protein